MRYLLISAAILLIGFTICYSRLRRTTLPMLKKKVPFQFPKGVHPTDIPHLKVPSKEFCNDMTLEPASHYVVLPWWYSYCQTLRDKAYKIDEKTLYNLGHIKQILKEANRHKRLFGGGEYKKVEKEAYLQKL